MTNDPQGMRMILGVTPSVAPIVAVTLLAFANVKLAPRPMISVDPFPPAMARVAAFPPSKLQHAPAQAPDRR
jgi:hypothetical protein